MKSHHTTTLHQFTLLSKRSSTSFEESSHKFKKSLKKHIHIHFLKRLIIFNHLTHFGNNSLSKLHWMKISLLHNYNSTWNRRIAAFIFKTYKIIISDTLLVNGLQLCNWALYDLFLFLLQYPMYPNKFVFRKTCV